MILAHPASDKRKQRQPEKQMQVGPENASGDPDARVKHMVMIVPVDAKVHEAQHVAHEHRDKRRERFQVVAVRDLHLEDHDRDDDRQDPVAKRLEPVLAHFPSRLA